MKSLLAGHGGSFCLYLTLFYGLTQCSLSWGPHSGHDFHGVESQMGGFHLFQRKSGPNPLTAHAAQKVFVLFVPWNTTELIRRQDVENRALLDLRLRSPSSRQHFECINYTSHSFHQNLLECQVWL